MAEAVHLNFCPFSRVVNREKLVNSNELRCYPESRGRKAAGE